MNLKFRLLFSLALVASMMFTTNKASAIPLSTLAAGGSITVFDKLYDNWVIESNSIANDLSGRTSVNLANIDVVAAPDSTPVNSPGPGLEFNSLANELSITQSGAIGANLDLAFRYDVTVLNPASLWVDTALRADFDAGTVGDAGNNRTAHIHEFQYTDSTLTTLFGTPSLLDTHYENDDGVGISDNSGVVFTNTFAGRTSGTILKDIDLSTESNNESVGVNSFHQHHSQVVPEPSTWALSGLAVLGFAGIRRRKQRKAAASDENKAS